jgi:hypothetical protein
MSPVFPEPKAALSKERTERPSGQEKERSLRTTEDTWQLHREVGGACQHRHRA